MGLVTAQTLPWYLITTLVLALSAVFYSMLRGNIIPSRVSDILLQSAEKRAEIAEAGVAANTATMESLVDSVAQLVVLAENQDKVLVALREHADRERYRRQDGFS